MRIFSLTLTTLALSLFSLTACNSNDEESAQAPARIDPAVQALMDKCEKGEREAAPNADPCTALAVYDAQMLHAGLFTFYVENLTFPTTSEEALAKTETVLVPGNKIVAYKAVENTMNSYADFCVVHTSGAWALMSGQAGQLIGRGTKDAECEFKG